MIVDFRVTLPASEWQSGDDGGGDAGSYLANYGRIYAGDRGGGSDASAMVEAMTEAGIDHAVLQAEWAAGDYLAMNDAVARIVGEHPDRLTGYCTVNPGAGDDMAAVVEREVTERGMRGVNLQPFSYRVKAEDKRFYPLYQKCQELGVPVTIHTSINFSNDRSIEYGRPLPLCEIACDFPDLTIVANHGGWPWVAELVGIAWKHRNVYIEIGAVAPKYIGTPGGGWETLLQFGNSLLQDQVLFATDNMIPFERAVSELWTLPLKPEVMEKWLGGNAVSLLNLPPA
ncbi:MAG TPA: amidohydrolase family protein [Dehalococcoidia bacterium]|nr:amidohydrolase family protein [Dehalococcoidia bacterium]